MGEDTWAAIGLPTRSKAGSVVPPAWDDLDKYVKSLSWF